MLFRSTPNFLYPDFKVAGKFKLSKNLFRRVRARDGFNAIYASSKQYTIKPGETPDSIASIAYDNPEKFWTILLLNNITNMNEEWPLDDDELDVYISEKYGSFANKPRHWETSEVKDSNQNIVLEAGVVIEMYTNSTEQNQSGYYPKVFNQKANNAGSFVVGRAYTITSVGTTDFTAIGASENTVGTVFTATGVGAGTGKASSTTNGNGAFETWSFTYRDVTSYNDQDEPASFIDTTVTAAQNLTKVTNREFEYSLNELKKLIYVPTGLGVSIMEGEIAELLEYDTKYKLTGAGHRISEKV